jgi:hypothetical protein
VADALRRRLSLAFFAADEPAVLLLRAVAIERAMVEEERERFEEKGGKRRELLLPLWEGNTRALGKGMKLSFFFFFFEKSVLSSELDELDVDSSPDFSSLFSKR